MKKTSRSFLHLFALQLFLVPFLFVPQSALAEDFNFPGLSDTVTVTEDQYGVPSIRGKSELDVAFVQGYIHARDRFFQMDYFRKIANGRLGELLGAAALPNDISLRTLGLGRAALKSWQKADADVKGMLQSYANGVNSWLSNNPLPPEYTLLELTKVDPWTPHDSFSYIKLLAWDLSFDTGDVQNTINLLTYQGVGEVVGFDGTALYTQDVFRVQPPDGRVTVPGFISGIGGIGGAPADATSGIEKSGNQVMSVDKAPDAQQNPYPENMLEMAIALKEALSLSPMLAKTLDPREVDKGSNEWAISGEFTESGYPMIANDPHLALDTPATFHESNLIYDLGEDSYSVAGVQFPGAPGIIQGCNDKLCWGSTVHPMDVTDIFQDVVQTNALGLFTHTVHNGEPEALQLTYQSFFVNVIGNETPDTIVRANIGIDAGGITFVSPRRNYGPFVPGGSGNTQFFIQYTGWGPTYEANFILESNRARDMEDFKEALQNFDVGSQNWIYGDVEGNIAYFTSAENPIRSDLAQGTVDGAVPPWFIRDGSGALNHEWLPVMNPQPGQALPYEILPFDEMPQVENPESGYIANANNDPVGVTLDNNPVNQLRPGGNGLYYLDYGYSDYRQGRVDRVMKGLTESDTPATVQDLKDLQANVQMLDAELTLPVLLGIMSQVPVQPGSMMAQALDVLSTWDYSTPTGLAEGWDAGDDPVMAIEPDMTEIRNSAAATVFASWRSALIRNTIDLTLTTYGLGDNLPGGTTAQRAFTYHLLNYETNGGIGASGLNFFLAGLTETVAGSLQQALELLSSDEFAPAFANSSNILDYRWGKLHRIVFKHPLDSDPFNIPNGGGFTDLAPDLPGLARQGGYETVDASRHDARPCNARGCSLNGFMFSGGPNRRFVGEMTADGVVGYQTIPGGQSGVFLHPNYSSQLPLWLTNSYHPLAVTEEDADDVAILEYTFGPAMPAPTPEEENDND
jgi:penicillin amidase